MNYEVPQNNIAVGIICAEPLGNKAKDLHFVLPRDSSEEKVAEMAIKAFRLLKEPI